MPSVRLSGVSFSYRDPVAVLSGVSLDLHAGWTGIVGENGSGKSTLLALVAGDLVPGAGSVILDPADAVVHLCPQRVDAPTSAIRALAESWTRADARLKARLDLEPEHLERWATTSPGERKRWQIGAALAARPDVLLLDEPSNHLDGEARALLMGALSRFRGVGLVVSHDRVLLEELTTQTVRVHDGSAELFRGAYGQARATWQERAQAQRRVHDRARQQERVLRRRLADERHRRAAAESKISTRSRMKSKKDSDARSMLAKGRVQDAEARLGRNVTVMRDAVERASARTAALSVARERGGALFVAYRPAPKRHLIGLDRAAIQIGATTVLRDVRLAVERHDRVHVAGPNGAGKTTLLRALLDAAGHCRERILYLPQVMEPEAGQALMAELRAREPGERGRILQVAAALGVDPERVLATDAPSPGELRKLALASGLGTGAWALILDEPTNHLDLPSIERIEAALAEYPGALILVSHDEPFARALTPTIWRLEGGRVAVAAREPDAGASAG